MVYKTKGTCSSEIEFEVENGILTDIHFVGGCPDQLSKALIAYKENN